MKNIVVLSLFSLLLFSCNENLVYREYVDPPGNLEWNKKDAISFDIKIIDVSSKNDVTLTFRHATGYRYPYCDVIIKETLPSGEVKEHEHRIAVMNEEGYLGEVAGDIYDIEEVWKSSVDFPEVGTYHYEIRHNMPEDKIHMVMEVGMVVEKVVK